MKVKEWIVALERLSPADKERELAVWLPGSLIELHGPQPMPSFPAGHPRYGKLLLIEGNVTSGSALEG